MLRRMYQYQKVRFLAVGVFNTGLDFLLLNCMVLLLGANVFVANTISVCVGITVSYLLNHYVVFRSNDPISMRKYFTFFAVTGFSSLVMQNMIIYGFQAVTQSDFGKSFFMLRALAGHNAIELNLAKFLAVGIGMVWNYLLYKYVIFRKSDSPVVDAVEVAETS